MYEYVGAAGDGPVGNRVWMMGGWWRARMSGGGLVGGWGWRMEEVHKSMLA